MTTSVALGDIAEFIRGVTYKPTDLTNANDPAAIACMRTKNIQRDLDDKDLVYIPAAPINIKKRLRAGDILVSSANSWNLVGKCSWIPCLSYDATFGGFTSILRSKPQKADARYVYHWFSTEQTQQAARNFGQQTTNISNLNHSRCLELVLPLPSLIEQRRIAAILDKADALRRRRQRALELLDALAQATLFDMFGDPLSNPKGLRKGVIGDLLESTQYGTSAKAGSAGTYPILRMGNISNKGRLSIDDVKYIDLIGSETLRYTLQKGDILFNRTNSADLVGKTAVFDFDDTYAYAGYLIRARTRKGASPRYISGYLNSAHGKKTLRGMAKSIVGMANINAREMQSIPILIPDESDQMRYQRQIEAIDHRIEEQRRSLVEVDTLFASLQHRAFNGQL